MIVLDTNVLSETFKPEPDQAVLAWLDGQPVGSLYLTSVTVAESLFGIGSMADGRRKTGLSHALNESLELFEGRILTFDLPAARCYADRAVKARAAGLGFPTPDGYIAAIAAARGFAVATRDTGAFRAAGVNVIDPWEHR